MLNAIRFGFESKISDARLSRHQYNSQEIAGDQELIRELFTDFRDDKRVLEVNLKDVVQEEQGLNDSFEITIQNSISSDPHIITLERRTRRELIPNAHTTPPLSFLPSRPLYEPEPMDELKARINTMLFKALDYWSDKKLG